MTSDMLTLPLSLAVAATGASELQRALGLLGGGLFGVCLRRAGALGKLVGVEPHLDGERLVLMDYGWPTFHTVRIFLLVVLDEVVSRALFRRDLVVPFAVLMKGDRGHFQVEHMSVQIMHARQRPYHILEFYFHVLRQVDVYHRDGAQGGAELIEVTLDESQPNLDVLEENLVEDSIPVAFRSESGLDFPVELETSFGHVRFDVVSEFGQLVSTFLDDELEGSKLRVASSVFRRRVGCLRIFRSRLVDVLNGIGRLLLARLDWRRGNTRGLPFLLQADFFEGQRGDVHTVEVIRFVESHAIVSPVCIHDLGSLAGRQEGSHTTNRCWIREFARPQAEFRSHLIELPVRLRDGTIRLAICHDV